MRTRRDRLIKNDNNESDRAGPPRTRLVTLRDLAETRVLIPPEIHQTNMSVIVTVANDGRLQPGLIESSKIPVTRPINDLARLGRARAIVSSLEATVAKTSVISSVKEVLVTNLAKAKVVENSIQLRVGVQTEILRCKALQEIFSENLSWFEDNDFNRTSIHRETVLNWLHRSLDAVSHYVLESLLQAGSKKLNDFTSQFLVPRWFFSKFSAKVPELKLVTIDEILFPKRISKMITFLEEEVSSEAFVKNAPSFSNSFSYLLNIVKLFGSRHPLSPLYPLPPNLSRLENLSDLPVIDNTLAPSTILTIAVVHMYFCAIPPKAISVDSFNYHRESFLTTGKEAKFKFPLDIKLKSDSTQESIKSILHSFGYLEADLTIPISASKLIGVETFNDTTIIVKYILVPVEHYSNQFLYDETLGTLMKVQYKDFMLSSTPPVAFQPNRELAKIFHLADRELNAIGIIFLDQKRLTPSYVPKLNLFAKANKNDQFDSTLLELYRNRLKAIKPIPPKQQNFGAAYTSLTAEAKGLIMGLERASFDKMFISNVNDYLRSFLIEDFQRQAVKVMTASLQLKEVILNDLVGEPDSELDETLIPEFS